MMNKKIQCIVILCFLAVIKLVAQSPELCVPSSHNAYEFAFTNDDKMMFSFGSNELKVWLTNGPFLLKSIPIDNANSMNKVDLFVPSDNKKLILNLDGEIRKLDLQTLEMEKKVFKIAKPSFTGFSKNGKSLYYTVDNEDTGESDIFKINLETGAVSKVIHLDREKADFLGADISVNNDESLLMSGSSMGGILLDLKTNKILSTFEGSKRILFFNNSGNLIVSNLKSEGKEMIDNLEEIEPRTMKIAKSTKVTLKTSDIPDFDGSFVISHNKNDKVMYEYDGHFYVVDLSSSTQNRRQKVKFNNNGYKQHQALLGGEVIMNYKNYSTFQSGGIFISAGGQFAFWGAFMTAYKIENIEKPIVFGILPYQPFMLSDLSQKEDLAVLAGGRIISFGLDNFTFEQLPEHVGTGFTSSYRYIASQKRVFMKTAPFSEADQSNSPYVYDLKNDNSQLKQLTLTNQESYNVVAMREYDSLNLIVIACTDRFFILDTRTLKVKNEVLWGEEYNFAQDLLRQSNDNHGFELSNDGTQLVVSLEKADLTNVKACYSLANKNLVWKYESANFLSNSVYVKVRNPETGQITTNNKVRFFNDKRACITLDAKTGKLLSSSPLVPNTSESSFFSPSQKFILNTIYAENSTDFFLNRKCVYLRLIMN